MPTGAGKSICYQVPALMMPGITLVISPLISLMKDQVQALVQAGVRAAYINSSLSERQIQTVMTNARDGVYKIIYIAPERLESTMFSSFAEQTAISMVTVDEAHCISQWGQDFRPSYLRIMPFIKSLPARPAVSAFTATATPAVREDIINLLELDNPYVLVSGFDRKNLFFSVQKPAGKFPALLEYLNGGNVKPGIVYCSTRAAVEDVCEKLNQSGYKASRYHAGLSAAERNANQDDFLYDRVQIMVATNAFGMGIDKSNVRFVIHYNMPKDIEGYYQEAGRAGRDGEHADCLLFYNAQDVRTNQWLIENAKDMEYPDPETERLLKERDHQRLRSMTFYCHTMDCLRGYILKYFGEKPGGRCDNCGSCNSNYEIIDITEEARKVLSCVIRAGERFGAKIITDVLRGVRSGRIIKLGLNRLSTYNISTLPETRLRDIINFLALEGYLSVTDGEYPVLRKGHKAGELLRSGSPVSMRLVKEDIPDSKTASKPKKVQPKHVNTALFDKLKALRLEIASRQGVPAFVVFSDSALTDMCMKLPAGDEEFKEVSGVGQVKLERYGKLFMDVIAEFLQGAPEGTDEPQTAAEVEISNEPIPVSVIADKLNCILLQRGEKKLTGAKINDWLVAAGFLQLMTSESGGTFKTPTDQGHNLGITGEERQIRGENRIINHFNANAQRYIIANLQDLIKWSKA